MLPDFPTAKAEANSILMKYLHQRIHLHLGFFGQIPRSQIPEGDKTRLVRADGTVDNTAFEKIEASGKIDVDPQSRVDLQHVIKNLDRMAKEIAAQQTKSIIAKVEQAAQSSGNVVNADKQNSAAHMLNDMLEKLAIDFDAAGEPILPCMVCGEKAFRTLIAGKAEIESDQVEQRRKEDILRRKKKEYDARESDRRLVD